MTIRLPDRTYFTFPELMARWQCAENHILNLISTEALIPSLHFNGPIVPFAWRLEDDGSGWAFTDAKVDQNGNEVSEWANGYFYLVDFYERGPFEGEFGAISKSRHVSQFEDGAYLVRPPDVEEEPQTFLLSDVIKHGVVMMEELALVERRLSQTDDQSPFQTPFFDADADDYPELLHIAVRAWENARQGVTGTPKQRVHDYLAARYPYLLQGSRDAIAQVVNWQRSGGRPAKKPETGG